MMGSIVAGWLKSDFEVFVPGVGRNFFDFGLSDVTCEAVIDVAEAIVNVVRKALSDHLNSAVQEVANPPG